MRGLGEGDVLPLGVWKDGFLFLNPLVSEFFATGGTKPALATFILEPFFESGWKPNSALPFMGDRVI